MSSEGDSGGQPSSTTISTIAVQAGDSQIIITLLKSGPLLQLQLTEAQPDLLEMGSNQEETKKLMEEHDQLLTKLKKHEGGVWALLEEADKTAEEKRRDEGEVYEAMADTLSQAWSSLISLLERRRTLLQLSSEFFDRALEFAIRIDEAEEFQSRGQELEDTESLRELLQTHSVMKRGLLERSLLVMTKREELMSCLRELQQLEELRGCGAGGLQGWSSSCSRVESLVEILQDRRRQVDLSMNQQQLHLQLILRLFQWERQEQEVTEWFRSQAEVYLERDALGSSLSESQGLLQDYRDFEAKAKEWSLLVERMLAQASELQTEEMQLHPEECPEAGQVCERSGTLKSLQDKLWSLMMGRQAQLQESNTFFDSANKAFEVLGGIESQIKNLKTQTMSLPELAKKHEELLRTIKDSSMEPIQRGQLMLQKSHLHSDQMAGVQRMLGYVRERVKSLSRECHAHRALADKRQQLVSSCEDLIDKISVWIKGCSNVLSSNTEPGEQLSQSEDLLNKHLELSEQTRETAADAENMSELLQELRDLECPEATELSNKASLLEEELKTVTRNISQRIESIRPYVGFLRIAEEVEEQMQGLRESYNRKPEEEENEEGGGGGVGVKEQADARWQSMLQRFLTMQDQGNNYINSSNMVSEKLNLNVRAAIVVVEKTMEDLNKRKGDLSDLWTSWQLHVSHIKSVKKQWKKFKEQLKKTLNDLRSVEEVLVPTTKIDLGSDLQTVSKLLENFNLAKPQFMQLNAEVEYMVKTSELLALKGVPVREKSERVTELLQLHHRIKEKIREYEALLNMAVKFHQLHNELEKLLSCEPVRAFSETSQARTQLSQHQERQSHVRHLHKLALSLGTDISTSVQQSQATGFCVRRLAERLERLERGCASWIAQAHRCEESLTSNVHYCVFKEEITELRESFKDLKKKLNNLKFNYMKKNEKARNLKAVKNQIQQIDVYVEKLQVLKRRIQVFTTKVSSSSERHLVGSSPREVEDAVNELQRQLGDFDRSVEEYRQNLEMSVKLQQAMEEYQFWCDEASATIVRVGKYSSQCQTREAVATLYKQFEKFVWPTVPQQEERITQITELAIKLHGAEEGKRYMEKTVTKHNEIVESIKELCNGLMDLEAKLQTEAVYQLTKDKQDVTELQDRTSNQLAEKTENQLLDCLDVSEQKETGHTPELTTGADGKEIPIKILTSKNPPLKKTGSQDLPDKQTEGARHTVPERQTVVSESSSFTQEEYSQTSRVETFTNRSTVERKEERHSSFSCTHTFNLSCSPHTLTERDRKAHALHQSGPGAQVRATSPPLAPSSGHSFSDIQKEFQKKERRGLGLKNAQELTHNFTGYHTSSDPQDAAGGLAEAEALTEESLSNDEYECTSPDDISLPPLSETPESNIVQLENDLDDGCCVSSSHSIHINQCNQYSQQSQTQPEPSCQAQPGPAESNPSPTAGLGSRFRAESSSFIQSPLTVPAPSLVSTTLSSILKTKTTHPSPGPSLPQGTADSSSFPTGSSSHNQGLQPKCGLPGASLPPDPASLPLGTSRQFHQTLYSLHESVTEIQECVHDPCVPRGAAASVRPCNTHAPPSSLTTEQDPDVCRPMAIREEIRLPSASRAMGSLAAQGPCLTRPLASATVVEGSPVTLEVEVTGYPEPTLTWLKNGESLASGDHIQLAHKEGKHTLFIERVKEGDAGVYEIQTSSSSGSVSSSAALQVTGNSCPDLFTSLQLDWHTCFGTLCILLWLLYLLVL
ncbi:coiled-coil domain-containing protein 141 isoform X2 [Osmerus eperlanus]|uniref:coiled-coil domain-containing protein 141 isoform X2 n=1 Tax=Osmerus eperlanus TaxID=29151 RepID=UPI002E1504B9